MFWFVMSIDPFLQLNTVILSKVAIAVFGSIFVNEYNPIGRVIPKGVQYLLLAKEVDVEGYKEKVRRGILPPRQIVDHDPLRQNRERFTSFALLVKYSQRFVDGLAARVGPKNIVAVSNTFGLEANPRSLDLSKQCSNA